MSTALQPNGLMCDLLEFPECAVIRNPQPKFSWIINDTEANAFQEAYQILVASDLETLAKDQGNMWDSGEPNPGGVWSSNPQSLHVPYEGEDLAPNATYHWKVRTWNGVENVSPWSEVQTFHTGKLTEDYTTATYPLDTTTIKPVHVVQLAPDYAFVDFGRAAFGTVVLTVDSPEDAEVEIHLGEVPDGAYAINRNPGGSRRYQMIPLQIQKGEHTYQVKIPTDPRNTKDFAILMPEDLFEVYPFRYCEIIGCSAPILRDNIHQIAVHYPFDDGAAEFTSSSRVLNDVWDLCKYSIKATTFCGYYVDGDRERIPYEADTYINQMGNYGCDREYTLARRTHEYLIHTPTWPTEWILDSVLIAWQDYLFTGDDSSIAQYYDDLKAKALTSLGREDGLMSVESVPDEVLDAIHYTGRSLDHFNKGLIDNPDWPQGERDGYDMRPINAEVNAFHYRAVVLMGKIAEALGKDDDVNFYRERALLLQNTFQEKLVDSVTGLVLDGEGSTHSSLHANMTALNFGLVPEKSLERVIAFIRSKGMACSVYGSQFLLEALYAANQGDYALSLMTSTAERSWAHMVYDVGTTISLEAWDDRFKPNQDWNHAWGAAPAGLIPFGLMGIWPIEPGCGKMRIAPQPGALAWAEITTPTIRGAVSARFNNTPNKAFHLEVELPGNMSAQLAVPKMNDDDPTITVDGSRVFGTIDGDFVMIDGIGSGRHTVERFVG